MLGSLPTDLGVMGWREENIEQPKETGAHLPGLVIRELLPELLTIDLF